MAAVDELFGSLGISGFGGDSFLSTAITIVLGMVILFGCGIFVWWMIYKKKKWNLKVEIKIPRNIKSVSTKSGKRKTIGTLNKEWGKGYYNPKQGVVYIKRAGKKPVPMKPFDVKRFLSSDNILTVIQIGIEDYRPVLDESYIQVKDLKTNHKGALINAYIDTSESKSWKNSFEREAKMTYSIKNWISEHGGLVAMGLVLLMNLVGFAIVISRMPKV